MREECKHDRRGREEERFFGGNAYRLFLRGRQWSGARWVGSGYAESKPIHHWYEGVGEVTERATEKKAVFTFETWKDERGWRRERSLRNFVLMSDRWDSGLGGYQNELPIAMHQVPDLVDFVCAPLFEKAAAAELPSPELKILQLRDKTLVEAGLVSDLAGQIHLPNVVPAISSRER